MMQVKRAVSPTATVSGSTSTRKIRVCGGRLILAGVLTTGPTVAAHEN